MRRAIRETDPSTGVGRDDPCLEMLDDRFEGAALRLELVAVLGERSRHSVERLHQAGKLVTSLHLHLFTQGARGDARRSVNEPLEGIADSAREDQARGDREAEPD